MNSELLISVDSVSKKFCRRLKRSLWYGVQDIGTELLGRRKSAELRKEEFWAVKDVSFELRRGECLGLIGHNGAGKSTLLKMLNGLIKPDKGSIMMKGRIGALIELGTGFNPILTGRENVYNNGAVLGFTKKEIDKKFDSIIDFAEIGDFIDTPVQNYSSGMKVRLGFAVASHMEPDVLLLDEVLAVGDAGFRMKSYNKIAEVIQHAAVIFVSHSMQTVATVTNSIMLMKNGHVAYAGKNVHKAIDLYFTEFGGQNAKIEFNEGAEIRNIKINQQLDEPGLVHEIPFYGSLKIDLDLFFKQPCEEYSISVNLTDKDLKIVAQFKSNKFFAPLIPSDQNIISIDFPLLHLVDGDYSITYFISGRNINNSENKAIMATYRHYTKIKVSGLNSDLYAAYYMDGQMYINDRELEKTLSNSEPYDE